MTRGPAGAVDLVAASAIGDAFGDDFPTQPIDVPPRPSPPGGGRRGDRYADPTHDPRMQQ